MTKYRVTFIYGSWYLWTDIERPHIPNHDEISFADIAQLAVNVALDSMPFIERTHVAHDYAIFEIISSVSGEAIATRVFTLDTLAKY